MNLKLRKFTWLNCTATGLLTPRQWTSTLKRILPHIITVSVSSCVNKSCCVWKTTFLGDMNHLWLLKFFCFHFRIVPWAPSSCWVTSQRGSKDSCRRQLLPRLLISTTWWQSPIAKHSQTSQYNVLNFMPYLYIDLYAGIILEKLLFSILCELALK